MKNNANVIVILGGGKLQLPLIQTIKKNGYRALVIERDANSPGVQESDIHLALPNFLDFNKLITNLAPYENQLRLCLTTGTDFTTSVAAINDAYSLTGLNGEQANVVTHKGKMRTFLRENSFLQPAFIVTQNKEDCFSWIKENPSKNGYVIKPCQNMGARGVVFFQQAPQLSYVFEIAERYSKNGDVILEHYIEANEISIDALSAENQTIITGFADRHIEIQEEHYFIETGHDMPSRFCQKLGSKIQRLIEKFAQALSALSQTPYVGALKGDIRITDNNEIFIGEIAARLSGGFMSTHTYPAASGINLMQEFLDTMLTKKLTLSQKQSSSYNHTCIERAVITQSGNYIKGDFETKDKNVQTVENFTQGQIIPPLKNNIGKLANYIILADNLKKAEASWQTIKNTMTYTIEPVKLSSTEIMRKSRASFNPKFCWGCKNCDGLNCASSIPGMGAVGKQQTFQDNIKALSQVYLLPEYIKITNFSSNKESSNIDISTKILGVKLQAPICSAPITGSKTNMGASITEWDNAFETGIAMKELGLNSFFGDGSTSDKYLIGYYAIKQLGQGFPVLKPGRSIEELKYRLSILSDYNIRAWGIDIDAVHLSTMTNFKKQNHRKSIEDITELASSCKLPFFVKGIMSIQDAALCAQAGASLIIVSNHGGRILDSMPATSRVLPSIKEYMQQNFPNVQIMVDGGIRSGSDIFKMLALGSDAVLIGRPLTIANVAGGRALVKNMVTNYLDDFKKVMQVYNLTKLSQIKPAHVKYNNSFTVL